MKEEIYRSQFRLPYELYEQLKESADANNRSVNAELVARLAASFEDPGSSMKALRNKARTAEIRALAAEASGIASSIVLLEQLRLSAPETAEQTEALMKMNVQRLKDLGDWEAKLMGLIKSIETT